MKMEEKRQRLHRKIRTFQKKAISFLCPLDASDMPLLKAQTRDEDEALFDSEVMDDCGDSSEGSEDGEEGSDDEDEEEGSNTL